MNNICLNCGIVCKANAHTITCDGCQGILHIACVGLSENDVKITRAKSRSIKVVCNTCNNNMAQYKDFKTLISSLQTEFTTAIEKLKEDFDTQLATLRSALHEDQRSPSNQFEEIVNEVMERQNRKQNLIIFGVEEQPQISTNNNNQRSAIDKSAVENILQLVRPDADVSGIKIQRLGRFSQQNPGNKPRPIRVILNDEFEVQKFIRNAKVLKSNVNYNNITLSFDRTPKQNASYRQVKEQLGIRISNGETNLRIKYINGSPKIVSNVRGLRSKISNFYNSVSELINVDIIALTETWLASDISNTEFLPHDFVVYRKDRDLQAMGVSRGVGVLLGINNTLKSSALDLSYLGDIVPAIDVVGVKLLSVKQELILIVLYVPPQVSVHEFQLFLEALSRIDIQENNKILICGDFNIPDFTLGKINQFTLSLNNFQSFLNLEQHNNVQNKYHHILDLVFSNIECKVEASDFNFVDDDVHHPSLCIVIKSVIPLDQSFPINNLEQYDFRKANFPVLYDMLYSCNWDFLDTDGSVDEICSLFYAKLHEIFDLAVPKFKIKLSTNRRQYPPWFNQEIRNAIRTKYSLHKLYKKYKTAHYYNLFKFHRSKCKVLIQNAYRMYMRKIENNISIDPKSFWMFLHNKKGSTRIPGLMRYDDRELTCPQAIVNAFAHHFSNVYIKSDCLAPFCTTNETAAQLSVTITSLSEKDILLALKNCKNTFTSGPDGIPSFLLKDCAYIFVTPLLRIFNLILKDCQVPELWKKSCITPIFKSGDKADVKNYRSISLLCNFVKTFESVMYKLIYSSVKSFITPYQHGFVEKRSTVMNLACFSQYVSQLIDSRSQVDAIYMDFSKAFDQIDYFILLDKLRQFGFSESLLKLFKSYLIGRVQSVRYRNFYSEIYSPTSGVPQGSNLGPLLFLLFINDIVEHISSEKLLFADDLKLFFEINTIDDFSYTKKQEPIIFNYNIDAVTLNRGEKYKDLGITFDSRLMFNDHMTEIVSKAYRMYGFIYRNCNDFLNISTLCNLYYALVRSQLEYGVLIWFPIYEIHIKSIESVQRTLNGAYCQSYLCVCVCMTSSGGGAAESAFSCSLSHTVQLAH
ncbi:uncharacterized protein LOC135127332 [Zophobas morio]|uniref:uncharacterized protein LOC135127332 n=1 Tax=Zophobas morio TaxID=2755281 RepID=UPI0030838459